MRGNNDKNLKYWNEKILVEINTIKIERPELISFMDELNVTIPNKKKPEITVHNLKAYYNTLITLLKKYKKSETIKSSII